MIFDILFYILIGFAILAVIVCHFLWFKMRRILKKEQAYINAIDNVFPFRFMGKFRSFVSSCSDDNKRAKYIQVYHQTRTWQTLTLISIAVIVVAYLYVI